MDNFTIKSLYYKYLQKITLSRGIIIIFAFSFLNTANTFLLIDIPGGNGDLAWAYKLGMVMGGIVSFSLGFVLWIYLTSVIFLISILFKFFPDFKDISLSIALTFIFPLIGQIINLFFYLLALPKPICNYIYYFLLIISGLSLIFLLKLTINISFFDSFLIVIVSVLITQILILIIF